LIEKEKVDVVLPGTEPEVAQIADAIDQFSSKGRTVVINPKEVVRLCGNKAVLCEWLGKNGFSVPQGASRASWKELVVNCSFPIVAKPTTNSGASRNVALLNSEAEIQQYLGMLPTGLEVVFQEYVEGPEGEFTVGVMVSKSGQIIDS